jgi:hypothetical protein
MTAFFTFNADGQRGGGQKPLKRRGSSVIKGAANARRGVYRIVVMDRARRGPATITNGVCQT